MAFFKFRQRGQLPDEPPSRAGKPAASPQETVDTLRRRARQRLLGALVLVLAAVAGFPLLFDTQPRPVAVDAPITIPDKDGVPPLRAPASAPAASSRVSADSSLGAGEEVVTAAADAPASAAAVARADQPASQPVIEARPSVTPAQQTASAQARPDSQERARREAEAKAKREADAKARAQRQQAEAERARALLEGRTPPPAPSAAPPAGASKTTGKSADKGADKSAGKGRFIIQIGAFADAGKVRQVRQQAERAGVKTYTQEVSTKDGKRTRVRVGPYASRAEAEQAAAALKKAGLSGSILAL